MTLFITSNEHKYEEVSNFLRKAGIEVKWKRKKYVEIQGNTTSEISMDSASRLMSEFDEDFFLEDTGLYIDSLEGFPGPYSSYVASTIGNQGILNLLKGKDRAAKFLTVITYCRKGECHQFEGSLEGEISNHISGNLGFGFDPVFIPKGIGRTLAEMSLEEKNSISHRIRALSKLVYFLTKSAEHA